MGLVLFNKRHRHGGLLSVTLAMMSETLIRLIAPHLGSSPVEYSRYAEVNQDFYKVFTSDSLWQRFNVCHLDSGIYDDFISSSVQNPEIMRAAWCNGGYTNDSLSGVGDQRERLAPNMYAQLGQLVTTLYAGSTTICDKNLLLKCFSLLDHGIIFDVSPDLKSDREVGLAACQSHGTNLQWLSESLRDDKEIALVALKKWDPVADLWGYDVYKLLSPRLQADPDVAQRAINLGVHTLAKPVRENHELVRYAVSQSIALYIGYWVPDALCSELEVRYQHAAGDFRVFEVKAPYTKFGNVPEKVEIVVGESDGAVIDWLLRVPQTHDPSGWLQTQHDRRPEVPSLR